MRGTFCRATGPGQGSYLQLLNYFIPHKGFTFTSIQLSTWLHNTVFTADLWLLRLVSLFADSGDILPFSDVIILMLCWRRRCGGAERQFYKMFHTSHSISWRLPPPQAAAAAEALLLCLRYQSCCCGAAAAKNLTTIKCHFLPRNLFLHFIRCQYNLQSSEFCPLALTALIHLHSSRHSGSLSFGAIWLFFT